MRNSWQEKLRLFWLHSIPLITTLVLMFLFIMPINSIEWGYLRPNVGLICVYYWTLKRGYILSYFSAFLIGLLLDVYSSSPLGMNAFLMMLTVFATTWLAHYFQNSSFGVGWFIFALTAIGIIVLKWVMLMIYFGRLIPLNEAMLNYLSTVMFYPFIASINVWAQKFLPQERISE